MNNGRAMHELREFVDRKSDVRTCKRGILKTTNNLAIFNRISQWGVVEQCEIMCWWERCLGFFSIQHVGPREELGNVLLLRKKQTVFRWDHLNSKEERQRAMVLNGESRGKLRNKLVNEAQIIAC